MEEVAMRKHRGFTLIELVVVVAIIGILVAIAFPSYQGHLRKGRRAQAESFLMEVANSQQQYLLDARAYAPDLATLGKTPPTDVSNFYNLRVVTATPPPSFTISANPIVGSQQEPDGVLSIDNTGAKSRAGNPGW
jgi:type IV pilus assembly protein PilE